MENRSDVEEALNQDPQEREKLLSGSCSSDLGLLKFSVSPKVNLGKIIDGDLLGGVANTQVKLEFGRTFEEDHVEIHIMVNGKVAALLQSPQKSNTLEAVFTATKRF